MLRPDRQPVSIITRILPLTFGLVTLGTYLIYTGNQLGGADSAELIGASYNLGIAHPPGYPLYVTIAKAFSLMTSFLPRIYSYNLFSTICFLLALLILWNTLRRLKIEPAVILTCGVFYIFSPLNLRWMTSAEVFALHILLCACGMYLTVHTIQAGCLCNSSRLLGLVAGLGAANHHTIVFLFPGFFLVYFYYWSKLQNNRQRLVEVVFLTAFFCIGLSFYLQPVISSLLQDMPVSAFSLKINTPVDLSELFLRKLYGTFKLTAISADTLPPFYWLRHYLTASVFSFKGLAWFPGILTSYFCVTVWRRWNLLTAATMVWLAGSLAFFLLIHSPVTAVFEQDHLTRMYLMPNLVVCFTAVLSLHELQQKIQKLSHRNVLLTITAITALWGTLINGTWKTVLNPIDVQLQFAKDALDSCKPNSILLADTDTFFFSTFYLQTAAGYREDVLVIMWPMTCDARYRNNVVKRLSARFAPKQTTQSFAVPEKSISSSDLIRSLVSAEIPVYLPSGLTRLLEPEDNRTELKAVYSGIVQRIESTNVPRTRKELLLDNAEYIQRYLEWLQPLDFQKQYPTEASIIELYYLDYLITMRTLQLSSSELILPLATAEKLCMLAKIIAPNDLIADYALGIFYARFSGNASLATIYLTSFLEQTKAADGFDKNRALAKDILNNLAVHE